MKGSELVPLSDYYKEDLIDIITISRGGRWWSAVLLLKDSNSDNKFISIYKWQMVRNEWKLRKNYRINNKEELNVIIEALNEFGKHLI
jgi:hypothetical protein